MVTRNMDTSVSINETPSLGSQPDETEEVAGADEAAETTETSRVNLNLRKERRIGTWNVRTLNGPGRV